MTLSTDQINYARQVLADQGTSAIQTILITGEITSGTFTISFNGSTTTPITYLTSNAAIVSNALSVLSSIGVGNVSVINTYPYTINFIGSLAKTALLSITADISSLVGTGISCSIDTLSLGGQYAFSDTELNAIADQAAGNFYRTMAYCFRILQANNAKFNDYSAGQTHESKSQLYQNVKNLAEYYEQWANSQNQVAITGMKRVPPRTKAHPYIQGSNNATNASVGVHPNWPNGWWDSWGV